MLHITILLFLSFLLQLSLKKALYRSLAKEQDYYGRIKLEYECLFKEHEGLKKENLGLEKENLETIALYDMTKDICGSLEEEKVFNIFKRELKNVLGVQECLFLKPQADLSGYSDHTVIALRLHKELIGYLLAKGVEENDRPRFHILSQQFLIGIKRALLYQKVQSLTIIDTLTDSYSRRYFLEKFSEELKRSQKFNLNASFLMIDIDHFKQTNDRYGHLVGDVILREVTRFIKESVRQIDFVGRYGGEELAVALPETDKEQALFAAERIRQAVASKKISAYDEELSVTVSIGISAFPLDGSREAQLIDKADRALYTAKESGRNRVCTFEEA